MDIVEGSRLDQLYPGVKSAKVNSIHHQAIKKLGDNLSVEASSSNGAVIEAIKWDGPSYVYGIQWHPEFMDTQALAVHGQINNDSILKDFISNIAGGN
jgi:putative glutamine amidotransferase